MKNIKNLLLFQTLITLCVHVTLVNAQNITNLMNLEEYLTKQNPMKLRPIVNQSEAINVNIDVFILALLRVNHLRQALEIIYAFNLTWKDELLTWNPSDFGGIGYFVPESESIWLPLLSCSECLEMNIFKETKSPVTIHHDGLVVWQPRTKIEVFCNIKVRYFPIDEQVCPINFFPMEYSSLEITLNQVAMSVNKFHYIENSEWEIGKSEVNSFAKQTTNSSLLEVIFIISRRPLFFLLNIVSPIVLLSFLNMFTFCLPDDSGEKILFSLTMLLSQTVYLSTISSELPPTSLEIVFITYYITSLLLISCLISIASITLLYFHHKRKKQQLMCKRNGPDDTNGSPNATNLNVTQHKDFSSNSDVINSRFLNSTKNKDVKSHRKKCCHCTLDMIIFCIVFIIWANLTVIFFLKIIFKEEGYGNVIGNIEFD